MNLDTRQKAFFLITLRLRAKNSETFLKLLPTGESAAMLKRFSELKDHDEEAIKSVATSELRRLARPKSLNYLSEVHDDWIVDILKDETPEMIAIVLRYLPAERVDAILASLSPELLGRLPKVADTYAVSSALVNLLKQRFESLFIVNKDFSSIQDFEFEHFCLFKVGQVAEAFLEIGYYEIALALKSIPKQARDQVLARLLQRDKQRVVFYIESEKNPSPQRLIRAQDHLLSKEIRTDDPTVFIEGLGYLIFAKSVLPRDLEDLNIIMRKMPMSKARALQKTIHEQIDENSEGSVVLFREDVLKAAKVVLSRKRES